MKLFLSALCLLLSLSSHALIRQCSAPQLHSIFDAHDKDIGTLPPFDEHLLGLPEPFFYDPQTGAAHNQASHPGNKTVVAGGIFLATGVLGLVVSRVMDSNQGSGGMLALMVGILSGLLLVIGGILFITGVIISGAHAKHHSSGK